MSYRTPTLSSEEEDALHRSTKKIKEGHTPSSPEPPFQNLRYKAKPVVQLPGAYKNAFSLVDQMHEDAESDVEEENIEEGAISLSLSKEDKIRVRSQWSNALIIKTFGRTIGYYYLSQKFKELWAPTGRLDLVDLGHDYFLARFELHEDLDHVLKDGPWFIGQHFLAIKAWEPEFKASTTSFSQVAIWIHLPELAIEFYDPVILKKIGSMIGPVLRIDEHTATNTRGRFARLCVQVCLDKPLVKTIHIGKFRQLVVYEGIHSLCFSYGRLDHKKENCPQTVRENLRPTIQEQGNDDSQSTNASQSSTVGSSSTSTPLDPSDSAHNDYPTVTETDQYGPWLLVSRKKPYPKKKLASTGTSFQPLTQSALQPPTRQNPISHHIPIPTIVTKTELGANKGKRKLVTPTNQTPKQTFKPKPKAKSPVKPSKAHSPHSPSQKVRPKPFSPNLTSSNSTKNLAAPPHLSQLPPFSFSTQAEATIPISETNHNAVGNLAQEQSCRLGRHHD